MLAAPRPPKGDGQNGDDEDRIDFDVNRCENRNDSKIKMRWLFATQISYKEEKPDNDRSIGGNIEHHLARPEGGFGPADHQQAHPQRRPSGKAQPGSSVGRRPEDQGKETDGRLRDQMADPKQGIAGGLDNVKERRVDQNGQRRILKVIIDCPVFGVVPRRRCDEVFDEGPRSARAGEYRSTRSHR